MNLSGQSSLLRPCSSGLSQCQPRRAGEPPGSPSSRSSSSVPRPPEAPPASLCSPDFHFLLEGQGAWGRWMAGKLRGGPVRVGDRPPRAGCPARGLAETGPLSRPCTHTQLGRLRACARVTPVLHPQHPAPDPAPQPHPGPPHRAEHQAPSPSRQQPRPGSYGPGSQSRVQGPPRTTVGQSVGVRVTLNRRDGVSVPSIVYQKLTFPPPPQTAAKQQAATPALPTATTAVLSLTTALYRHRQLSISRATNLPVRKPGLLAKLGTSLHVFKYGIQRKGHG